MRAAAAISESRRDCPLAAAPNATSSGVSHETPDVDLCCRSDGADVASLQPPGHGGDSGSDPRGFWGIQSRQCWEGWEGDSCLRSPPCSVSCLRLRTSGDTRRARRRTVCAVRVGCASPSLSRRGRFPQRPESLWSRGKGRDSVTGGETR